MSVIKSAQWDIGKVVEGKTKVFKALETHGDVWWPLAQSDPADVLQILLASASKHRKNCECSPLSNAHASSFFMNVGIVVPKSQLSEL